MKLKSYSTFRRHLEIKTEREIENQKETEKKKLDWVKHTQDM